MKKFTFLVGIALCLISLTTQASPFFYGKDITTEKDPHRICVERVRIPSLANASENESQAFKNIIKINVSSLVFKTGSFQFERLLNRKMSVALGIRLSPASGLPFRSSIENTIENKGGEVDEEVKSFINGARMSGFAFTPEFRYYFGKEAGRGFYLAPFVRYEQFNLRSTYLLKTDTNETVTPIPFRGQVSVFGIGILLGSQFHIGGRLTLDWWILGPYFTANTLKLSAGNLNLSPDEQNQLKESLDGIEFGWAKISSDVSAERAKLKARGSFVAIRGFGFCLGVRL